MNRFLKARSWSIHPPEGDETRGAIRAVVPQVYEHTTSLHICYPLLIPQLRLTSYPQGRPHLHLSAITPHRKFIRTTGQGRSSLASTLNAALICLVAQVVVTWLVAHILLFFLTTKLIFRAGYLVSPISLETEGATIFRYFFHCHSSKRSSSLFPSEGRRTSHSPSPQPLISLIASPLSPR